MYSSGELCDSTGQGRGRFTARQNHVGLTFVCQPLLYRWACKAGRAARPFRSSVLGRIVLETAISSKANSKRKGRPYSQKHFFLREGQSTRSPLLAQPNKLQVELEVFRCPFPF